MKTTSFIVCLCAIQLASCQFFYNDEEDRGVINPSLVNKPVSVSSVTTNDRAPNRKQYQRQPFQNFAGSPSVFANIGLGEAPDGVYIPPDSLINVLRSPSPISYRDEANQELKPNSVQQSSLVPVVQPNVQYDAVDVPEFRRTRKRNSVVPEVLSNAQYDSVRVPQIRRTRQRSSIVPVVKPNVQYDTADVSQTRPTRQRSSVVPEVQSNVQYQTVDGPQVRRTRKRLIKQRRRTVPTVDIDTYRVRADDFQPSISMGKEQRSGNSDQTAGRPQQNYRSAFENLGLGETPDGVFLPQDSLLNLLRKPTSEAQKVEMRRTG